MLLATLDASITLIAMPDIFRGIHLDPLVPGNSFYLLWMILGYLVVTSVLIVSLGRLGDMFGRVRIYNLGFVIYTVGVAAADGRLADRPRGRDVPDRASGSCRASAARACWPTPRRSSPTRSRPTSAGWRSGINNIVGVSGMFVGLVLGGLLAPINWRLVFLISVPVGLFGTVWAYLKLEERSTPRRARDRLVGQRHVRARADPDHGRGHLRDPARTAAHADRLGSPRVIALLALRACVSLVAFVVDRAARRRPDVPPAAVPDPGVHVRHAVDLPVRGRPRRPDVHADHLAAGHLAARSTATTSPRRRCGPGIYMLPLTVGMLLAGPTSGYLSDRFGARPFATGGMVGAALSFVLLALLPTDFSYPVFAAVLFLIGRLDGAVRLAQPRGGDEQPAAGRPRRRRRHEPDVPELGAGAVDRDLLHADDRRAGGHAAARDGERARGARRRAADAAQHRRTLPPVSILFAAFLGYNPIQHLLGAARAGRAVGARPARSLTGRAFFPQLISGPFRDRPARGVRVRDRRLPGRRGGVADARRPLPPRRRARPTRPEEQHAVSSGTASPRSR